MQLHNQSEEFILLDCLYVYLFIYALKGKGCSVDQPQGGSTDTYG